MTFCTSHHLYCYFLCYYSQYSSRLLFPLPRTCTNCVRAFEHINYLLMLTFEEEAFFVLTPTAGVSAAFTSPGCCHGNRLNLAVRESLQSWIQKSLKVTWNKVEQEQWVQRDASLSCLQSFFVNTAKLSQHSTVRKGSFADLQNKCFQINMTYMKILRDLWFLIVVKDKLSYKTSPEEKNSITKIKSREMKTRLQYSTTIISKNQKKYRILPFYSL